MQLSAVATGALLTHLGTSWYRQLKRLPSSSSQLRAARLLRTHSGILLALLLVSDFVQAVGFTLSFHWTISGGKNAGFGDGYVPPFCTAQAVIIQMSDVASALLVCRV
jgi:hypothetical protein